MESYVQGVERGGRDGGNVMAIMYTNPTIFVVLTKLEGCLLKIRRNVDIYIFWNSLMRKVTKHVPTHINAVTFAPDHATVVHAPIKFTNMKFLKAILMV